MATKKKDLKFIAYIVTLICGMLLCLYLAITSKQTPVERVQYELSKINGELSEIERVMEQSIDNGDYIYAWRTIYNYAYDNGHWELALEKLKVNNYKSHGLKYNLSDISKTDLIQTNPMLGLKAVGIAEHLGKDRVKNNFNAMVAFIKSASLGSKESKGFIKKIYNDFSCKLQVKAYANMGFTGAFVYVQEPALTAEDKITAQKLTLTLDDYFKSKSSIESYPFDPNCLIDREVMKFIESK